jgi:hypothetical protein
MPTPSALRSDAPDRQSVNRSAGHVTAWRQPVVWLGAAIFLASLIGCLVMIVLAGRHDDPAAGAAADYLMKVPIKRLPVHPPPSPR